jgi:hypothetical protein
MKRLRSLLVLRADECHVDLDKIAYGLRPADSHFPWDDMRNYGDIIVRKQKGLTIPDGLDVFLTRFIRQHTQKDC